MNTTKDFIPQGDRAFVAWLKKLVAYITAHGSMWGIPPLELSDLQMAMTDLDTKFNISDDPATRTTAAVTAKTEARKLAEQLTRAMLRQHITYNTTVTDADRQNMEIPIHKTTRTPVPIPDSYPEFETDSSRIRRLTIHFHDAGSSKRAKPAGVHGAEIRWAILDAHPAEVEELSQSSFDTKTPFTLDFKESQRGKTVYFCLRWENTRGEKGPWSEIVSAIVP